MNNRNIGFLGGGPDQLRLAGWFGEQTEWTAYAMLLQGPEISPRVQVVEDFRDALWLCSVLVLPDPVCRQGEILFTPLWPGRDVEAGQFLGSIGKGVLLLTGETNPAFRRAAASKEVAVTELPRAAGWEEYRDSVVAAVQRAASPRFCKKICTKGKQPPVCAFLFHKMADNQCIRVIAIFSRKGPGRGLKL